MSIDWTKPLRMIATKEPVKLIYTIPDHPWGRMCVVKVDGKENYISFTEEGNQFNLFVVDVENIPVVRSVTRYFLAHASDKGDTCSTYLTEEFARIYMDPSRTGILGRIDWTITDGKTTDQVMTVLECWNAPTSN